jgi:hypothetical protein
MTAKSVLAVLLLMLASVPLVSAEDAQGSKAMDPAMMEAWKKAATPGPDHKILDSLAGEWDHTVKHRMTPEAAWEEMKGENTNKWILGGRFLQSETKGPAMVEGGEPFEGWGFIGFDNVTNKYQSVWLDNMGTGMMISTGEYDSAIKTLKENGDFSCPLKGTNMPYRAEWKFIDNNSYSYEMYTKDDKGKEFQSLIVSYTRK